MIDMNRIYTYDFFHPQKNLLSLRKENLESEDEFAWHFARIYKNRFAIFHKKPTPQQAVFIREMPVENHGISDLVVVSWQQPRQRDTNNLNFFERKSVIRAFEMKMSDWRGGLMQAHRYKYFSNTSIVVLPRKKLEIAKQHIYLFKTLRVGLWGFDPESESIITVYTPRPKKPLMKKYSDLVIKNAFKTALS